MTKDEILIIGTDPPCPRCDYLNQMVVDIVNDLHLSVPVRHVGYTSDEAQQIAKEKSLVPGTAKEVAKRLKIELDWPAIQKMIDTPGSMESSSGQSQCCPSAAARWTPELDDTLRPCEEKALEAGIMMTPVLVINGKPVYQGSVPDTNQTRNWIESTYKQTGKGKQRPKETVIEVLGPGCKKCDTLYDNVLIAIESFGGDERCSVKKRTDIGYFQKMGVAVTPGLITNGKVVSTGRVLTPEQIIAHLELILRGGE
jgi:hypothetical protein